MRLYFGLISVALGYTAVSGGALSWDGSYVLFKMLDTQSPFVAHNRVVNVPLHWIVLLVNRYTSDVSILQMVFGLVYAVIPLGALALSWWIVRHEAPSLFIWAALGVGVGTLPGQFCLICEAMTAVSLFWPMMLAILTYIRKRHAPVVVLLVIAMFFTHPMAMVLLALSAGLAFAVGLRFRAERGWLWMWAVGLSAIAAVKACVFWWIPSEYEFGQASLDILRFHFDVAVAGLPLWAMLCAWCAGAMIFVAQLLRRAPGRQWTFCSYAIAWASLATAGGILVLWARDPQLWKYATSFRGWALFSAAPFMLLAAVEALRRPASSTPPAMRDWHHRLRLLPTLGVIFLLVLVVQSTVWFNLTQRLRQTIEHSAQACISAAQLGWLTSTPLHNWTTPTYAILLQGQAPAKLVLEGEDCTDANFADAVRIAPWELRSRAIGWFDLHRSGFFPPQNR
jgi:hypothetical protein